MTLSDKIEAKARELMPEMRRAMVAGKSWSFSHETVDRIRLTLEVEETHLGSGGDRYSVGTSWLAITYLPNTDPFYSMPVLNYRDDQAAIQRAAYMIAALSTVN